MKLVYTEQALEDAKKLAAAGFREQAEQMLDILRIDPFQASPPYGKLVGDLKGAFFRRITIQHRIVYEVREDIQTVKVIRMWSNSR